MKIFWRIVALSGTLCLTGCFSLEHSRLQNAAAESVVVQNYGWRLFYFIPLCCGNATPEPKRSGEWAFFRDDVTMEKVQARFMEYAATKDGTITDLTWHNQSRIFVSIPFTSIPIPLPYIFCYKEVQLSGVIK